MCGLPSEDKRSILLTELALWPHQKIMPSQGTDGFLGFRSGPSQISSPIREAVGRQRHESSPALLLSPVLLLVVLAVALHLRVPRAAAEVHGKTAVVGAAEGESGVLDMRLVGVPLTVAVAVRAAIAAALLTSLELARAVGASAKLSSVRILGIVARWLPGLDSRLDLLEGVAFASGVC